MTSVGENGNHQTGEEQVEMEVLEVERSSNHYIMIATGGGN